MKSVYSKDPGSAVSHHSPYDSLDFHDLATQLALLVGTGNVLHFQVEERTKMAFMMVTLVGHARSQNAGMLILHGEGFGCALLKALDSGEPDLLSVTMALLIHLIFMVFTNVIC